MEKEKILVVVGPTASGKTATGVALAKKLDGEIVSADSMQIYQQMSIGTAKPTPEEMAGVPHHLMDFVPPDKPYSVAHFVEDATACIQDIHSRGKVPIVLGGTGLYINGLTLPWDFTAQDRDDGVRQLLEDRAQEHGPEGLYRELMAVDPDTAAGMHPNNVKRVIRALEIYRVTGRTKSEWDAEARSIPATYDYVMTGIHWERGELYDRINERVDQMFAQGLLEEVQALLDAGYGPELTSLKAIGYKELFPYLRGEQDLEETIRILKRDTRHFAKRQLTWFRKDARIKWFDFQAIGGPEALADQMAMYYKTIKEGN
ncbi:tRNA dimethylallyltransferase [Eubacterium aggregans]|uniref:tRNA dimethylallyltransferase n=1 Tax=Eubacterium aggregans TaxID=81409 RepID=A0A1H3ZME1_9FIRM|nr:tRNA (adenosine(37)-N6)-dimethylallyltransferase MiaA [Eubacterium aggregans]SEA24817.1 tRNA dimethylallyltransferase [Eubacterium aggregans]